MKNFAVVGQNIEYSLSPALFAAGFSALNLPYTYAKEDIRPDELENLIEKVRTREYSGLSITIPYKEAVIPYLDQLTPEAREIGAVNTVFFRDEKLIGENTDWSGFKEALLNHADLENKKILIYGAGGVARACLYALKDRKENVFLTNRNEEKGRLVAGEFGISFASANSLPDADIVINATPAGISTTDTKAQIFNLAYKNTSPAFAKEMLLYQAAKQFELFTGQKAPIETMKLVLSLGIEPKF